MSIDKCHFRLNRTVSRLKTRSLILRPSIVGTDIHGKFFKLVRGSPSREGEGKYLPKIPASRLDWKVKGERHAGSVCIEAHCFPLDEARTRTAPHTTNPGAIFHGILLPSAHATPRQNARRRRDASFYLSAIYLPTRSLPNRPRRGSRPCRGQI